MFRSYKTYGDGLTLVSTVVEHKVEVDFLTEPEGAEKLPDEWLASVQQNLKACVIEGCSVVFDHNFEVELRAVIPGDDEATAKFNCADIVASLTMKGLALYRMKDKDSYDIYAVGSQGPTAVARFIGSEYVRNDLYQRVKAFLEGLPVRKRHSSS